jgi:hypothetical protein
VNLSDGTSLRAGEPGQGRKAIVSDGLNCATSDGGRSGKSSPPEGPGKTAKSSKKIEVSGRKNGEKGDSARIGGATNLLNILMVFKSENGVLEVKGTRRWGEGRKREGKGRG